MSRRSNELAENFILNETQFHLGFLPTEQSNPLTRSLETDFKTSPEAGIRTLQKVDRNVLDMARRIFAGDRFQTLVEAILRSVTQGHKVVFSGCGATGRLSILLEAMWRDAVQQGKIDARYANSVSSIMTGGDFALIRSVEFFEDYAAFGCRQVEMQQMKEGDTLVAITEGGETSSVLGTVYEAVERKCAVFLLFNNPAELLAKHIERSRKAIEDPRVCVLDLSCGPMGLAGSTRMQATTSEQLVAGAALETAALKLAGKEAPDYAALFETLLGELESETCVKSIAESINFEADVYRHDGKVTYFAHRFLLDIFTDTTERTPTFKLPPFRRSDEPEALRPWAFVKDPLYSTRESWQKAFNRPMRCLDWNSGDLKAMGAPENVAARPPRISEEDMMKIEIGSEGIARCCESAADAAILVSVAGAQEELKTVFERETKCFSRRHEIDLLAAGIGSVRAESPLELMRHMAIKLYFNTLSTGTMVAMGRVTGNWMSFVDCTNKKLIDRATRLIAELSGLDYHTACCKLFEAMEFLAEHKDQGDAVSPVQYALKQCREAR